jgi:hypothetical protein
MHSAIFSSSLSACLLVTTVIASTPLSPFDTKLFESQNIINRDIAIIGGGAAGTHAAISLKDKGKSVVVVEKKGKLGGHTETYMDPETGTSVDLGVTYLHNVTVVTDYLKRLDIPVIYVAFNFPAPTNYDLRTGKAVDLSLKPSADEISTAFAAYLEQYSKYPKLADGTHLPNPVPADLLMPFGDFVKKYSLQNALPLLYNQNWGVGDILFNPTVEQMRYWSPTMVNSSLSGFLTSARHNNGEIYTKAELLLEASNVLLNSEVTSSIRLHGKAGVRLIVKTPTGNKLILAKKLVIAIPPKLEFLAPLDLDSTEEKLFGKYIDAGYYVGLIKNTGFPANLSVANSIQNTTYNLPPLPAVYNILPTRLAGVRMVYYGSKQSTMSFPLTDELVKADMIRSIKTLQQANPDMLSQQEPEFVDYVSHAPYSLQVSAQEIKDRFYEKLYALQGGRNTFFTGAAWKAHDSGEIWKFTQDVVLPQLLADF